MSFFAPNLPHDKHCFFDRHGGVSQGKYASLNVSLRSLDSSDNIYKNLEIAANYYHRSLSQLNILTQGISTTAVYIDHPSRFEITADGAVTDKPDIILSIRTADCAPILLRDNRHGVIGVAHAGWRGALRGIIDNTIALMEQHGAQKSDIAAAIGPCLQKLSFECRDDMRDEFLQTGDYQEFFTPLDNGAYLFDAEAFCRHRLRLCGIENISASGINTYTDDNYFSYRRCCHQKLISAPRDFPSHLSTIML